MPDLPDLPTVNRDFLSIEVLPFLAQMWDAPEVLTAPLPSIKRLDDEHWQTLGKLLNFPSYDTMAVHVPRWAEGEAPVAPGIYVGPNGWDIYTLVHELVHWVDFDVLGNPKSYQACHEANAYGIELAFVKAFPHYRTTATTTTTELAEALRKRTWQEVSTCKLRHAFHNAFHNASISKCDILIVGAGPAGLSCAINAASEGACVTIAEAGLLGGQSTESFAIENYAGFPSGLTGKALAAGMVQQAARFGCAIRASVRIIGLRRRKGSIEAIASDGSVFGCNVCVLAMGVQYRRLGQFDNWAGQGLSYGMAHDCGTSVVVVGGANSAGQAACGLAQAGKRVTLVSRSPLQARMSAYLIDKCHELGVTVREGEEIAGLDGFPLQRVRLTGGDTLFASNVLLYIGAVPHTAWLPPRVARDHAGFIYAPEFTTSHAGVFAIGDVRAGSVKRIAAAVGEGSNVMPHIHAYLSNSTKGSN